MIMVMLIVIFKQNYWLYNGRVNFDNIASAHVTLYLVTLYRFKANILKPYPLMQMPQ